MHTRPLTTEDIPALEALLLTAPEHNPFHLSAVAEYGLAPDFAPQGRPWAVGAFRGSDLAGVVMALRGTGGIYHNPGDAETLQVLAQVAAHKALDGGLTLLSGHASQIEPLLSIVGRSNVGHPDRCYFRTIRPGHLVEPAPPPGFARPRAATMDDMERLIDFYQVGFYSLAHLPTRAAWRTRLSEQIAYRTLFVVDDPQGRVASAAQSSAEGGGTAMLGGVATLVTYRGRGLSSWCVAELCKYLFARGTASISLFYLKANVPAARVYDKLGFVDAGEWLLAPLGFGSALMMRPGP